MTEREEFEKWAKGFGHPYHDVVPKHGPCSSDPSDVDSFSEMAWAAFERGFYCGAESAKPRWIPVEERLPEEDNLYLVVSENYDEVLAANYNTSYPGEWLRDDGIQVCGVTKYMPLPEAPE